MATGYTADVADGKVTDFKDFAMACARAFGALIDMRDDPAGTPIPHVITPSDYNAKRLAEAKKRMTDLEAMSLPEREAAAEKAHADKLASHERYVSGIEATKSRYLAMIAKVERWQPPTPDHSGMKSFMLDQLRDSVKFDCTGLSVSAPTKMTAAEWYAATAEQCSKDILYYSTEQAKEDERAASKTRWIAALRASLA